MTVHLIYAEPDPDRWLPGDRYPRRLLRRLLRGSPRPGGQMRVFLNLCAGLDCLGVPFLVNDYRALRRNTEVVAGVLGKAPLFFGRQWTNPLLLGPCVLDHPIDAPNLFAEHPTIRRLLVPGPWMEAMFEPAYGSRVKAWPIGIDTDYWHPATNPIAPQFDILLYDKLRWRREVRVPELLHPICTHLERLGLSYHVIRYGMYNPKDYRELLMRCRLMMFLCEHETQGLAYQEALACNVPVLAWKGAGVWEDPNFWPHRVSFGPVSSTPYWSKECGEHFISMTDFVPQLQCLLDCGGGAYAPREFVLKELTLASSALAYLDHLKS